MTGPSLPGYRLTARQRWLVLLLLAVATAIGSTGLAAGGTAGALLAVDLTGSDAAAGLPLGMLVVGSAAGALLITAAAARGRRGPGLALGYGVGALGAVIVILAAVQRSVPLLLAGSFVLGTANPAVFLTRYAAAATADLPSQRGRALGAVFFATAVGAVLSSALLGPSGNVADALGLPRLAGLYLVAALAFGCSATVLAVGSSRRVGPLGEGSLVLNQSRTEPAPERGDVIAAVRSRRVRTGLVGLAATNFVMSAVMTIAPIHLVSHGQHLDLVGLVVALHVTGMFAPSPLSGYLADRYGASRVLLLGVWLLASAGIVGMLAEDPSLPGMTVQLVVLGVGWNMGVVGASTLLGAAVTGALHPHVEGMGEVLLGLAAAVAGPVAGVAASAGGYRGLSIGGTVVAAVGIYVAVRAERGGEVRMNQ